MDPKDALSGNTQPSQATTAPHTRSLTSYPSVASSLKGEIMSGGPSGARTPRTPSATMDENAPLLDSALAQVEQGMHTPTQYGGISSPAGIPQHSRKPTANWAKVQYYVPSTAWIPNYSWSLLGGDVLAGITVASMLIPQSVSYATSLAKLSPVTGLFSAAIPGIVYALLGTSRQLNVAPEAALSLLVGQAVSEILHHDHHENTNPELAGLAISTVITFQVGLISFLLGFFRLGFLDVVLSRALLRGFVTAVAVVISIEQLIPMFGLTALHHQVNPQSTLEKFVFLVDNAFTNGHRTTTIISFAALAALVLMRNFKNLFKKYWFIYRIPEVLIVVVVSTVLSDEFGWDEDGVDILGSVPINVGGDFVRFPLHKITLRYLRKTTSTAVLIAVAGFLDSIVAAKQNAAKFEYSISPNRELVALGASNIVASFVPGTLPAYGSITRSRVNGDVGGRTQMASLVCSALVLLATFFLLPWLYFLPKCVLASIICLVVFSLLAEVPHDVKFYWNMRAWLDLTLMTLTFVFTIVWNVEIGIAVSVVISLLLVVHRSSRARMAILGRVPGTDKWKSIADTDETEAVEEVPGVLMVRLRENLDFANTAQLKERLRRLELYGLDKHHPSEEPHRQFAQILVFHMADVETIDASAVQIFREILETYQHREVGLYITHLKRPVRVQFERAGIVELLGEENILKDMSNEQERARRGQLGPETEDRDWVVAQTMERKRRELEADDLEYAERLRKAKKKEELLRKAARGRVQKRQKVTHDPRDDDLDDAQFLPEFDQVADEEDNVSPAAAPSSSLRVIDAVVGRLHRPDDSKSKEEEEIACTKIYYASRTHSQLSQVLHELKKLKIKLSVSVVAPDNERVVTSLPSTGSTKRSLAEADENIDDDKDSCNARAVSLGSRKQLCINEKLKAKAGDLDEACRQRLSEKGDRRCRFLPPADDEARMLDFRDQVLATPKDIEDMVEAGLNAQTCPYFGARRAIPQAQLVMLPYNLLLQKAARESLGIDLTNQVVIVDEAHNLISTLLSLSAVNLPLRTLTTSLHQLSIYLTKFRNRLSTTNSLHLKRLTGLLEALSKYATEWGENRVQEKDKKSASVVMTSGELLDQLGQKVQGINFLEVEVYLRKSKIARKISGYCVKELERAAGQDPVKLAKLARLSSSTPPLHTVESFILSLTTISDDAADGRVTFTMHDGQVEIKYQHLNPSTHFKEVIDTARSVVLAGGTMSPISDVTNQLFSTLAEDRLTTFSCGHIIPISNLQTLILKKGPRGGELQFKYERRNDQSTIAELGQIVLNFSSIVPGGMVIFVPSYSFLHLVTAAWEGSGMMDKFRAKKKVFMEPQEASAVEAILREYATEIQDLSHKSTSPDSVTGKKQPGAMLFAVIGAKLSEGLNFTDELARAVLVVGLPFANLASPELKERMNYVNRLEQSRGSKRASGAKDAATELYENMCMNAVNQSIGRAIRHRGDWAALVLIDGRYSAPRIRQKLPKWIGEHTTVTETFGEAMKELGRFYREKRAGST
ncbi:hypothetical protein EIP91_001602 [Steccherinum ochraceum]|uniref:ATP-dependent DNA helicase CHL1 n=1 Tax=Steccherinum ochraceum TaxID=92696 RepID=A0A4R0RHK1_9APHY|nr:hypothetical protein EIP91_001602 [Steccherinum ochraceum]